MDDSLYNNTNSATEQITNTIVANSGNQTSINIDSILSAINTFSLAFCIIFTIIYLIDFYYFRVKYTDYDISREERGQKSMYSAMSLWFGYIVCLVCMTAYIFVPAEFKTFTGWLCIVVFILKLLVVDFPNIPGIGKYLGWPGSQIEKLLGGTGDGLQNLGKAVVEGIVSAIS